MWPIDLKALYLQIGKNKYPVLSADTVFSINALPTVRVVISAAENVDGKNSSKLPTEREKSEIANLVLEFTTGDENVHKVVLFCGHILTEAPTLGVSISSVRGTVTYQLVCDAGKISGIPFGSLYYYGTVAGSVVNVNATPYSSLVQAIDSAAAGKWGELGKQLQNDPATAIAQMLDTIRTGFSKGANTFPLLQETLLSACGPLSVKLPQPNTVMQDSFVKPAKNALQGSPVLSVYLSLLRQVYLGFIPQPVCEFDVPCKLIVRPLNPWNDEDPDEDAYLGAERILSVQEQTLYQLDQRIDYWIVVLPGDTNRLAVYGPNTGGEKGKARCLTEKEFKDAMAAMLKAGNSKWAYAAARMIGLPGWLNMMPKRRRSMPDDKNGGNKDVTVIDPDTEYVEDIAKKVAITGYLNEGCSAIRVGLTVPLEYYLGSLYLLGRMMVLQLPQMTAEGVETETRDYYGLLDSMGMHIGVERKALQATCSMHFSNVHTAEMHEQFKAAAPLYDTPNNEAGLKAAMDLNNYFGA